MERMQEKAFYENSTAFMREDSHFTGCTDEELLRLRDRISQWIGQAIDQRAVLGWAMDPLLAQAEPSARTEALNAVRGLCWTTHDVLWVAWKAIGEYMAGAPIEWAGGLKNKTIRNVIADCFEIVKRHDEMILEHLKKGFLPA